MTELSPAAAGGAIALRLLSPDSTVLVEYIELELSHSPSPRPLLCCTPLSRLVGASIETMRECQQK